MPEDDGIYEVERIIRHRWTGQQFEFLVKWKGFGHKFNTWQAKTTMNKARQVVGDYWRSKRFQKRTKATTAKAVKTRSATQTTQGTIIKTETTRASTQNAKPATSVRRSSRLAKVLSTSAPVSLQKTTTRQKLQAPETTMVMDTASQPGQSPQASLQPISHDRLVGRKKGTRFAKLDINNNISTGHETEGDGKYRNGGDDGSEMLCAVKQEQGVLVSPTRSTGPDMSSIIQFEGQNLHICKGFRQGWDWDEEVAIIEKAKVRKVNGVDVFYLVVRWKDGTLSVHESYEVASKCVKKVLNFYENQIMACYL